MNPAASRSKPSTVGTTWDRRELRSSKIRRLGYAGFLILLVIAFLEPLVALVIHAAGNDIHSHILLIPVVSAYLLLLRRRDLPKTYESSPVLASLFLFSGLAVLFLARTLQKTLPPISENDFLSLSSIGFVCLLTTGAFAFLGRKWVAAAAFPLLFLLFIVPIPDRVLHFLENASQLGSTEVAAVLFTVTGVPMLRDGTIFQLPGITIQVAQECSGIRSSLVLFITTLAAAHLFLRGPGRRVLLIAMVIPLALVRNGFRIWVIGFLCVEVGPEMIHSFIHTHGGPFFFALSLVPLFLLLWWLRRREQEKANVDTLSLETPTS